MSDRYKQTKVITFLIIVIATENKETFGNSPSFPSSAPLLGLDRGTLLYGGGVTGTQGKPDK